MVLKMNKLLFLDFDGVLHPNFSRERDYFNRINLLLEALVGNASGLEIIVSHCLALWAFPANRCCGAISKTD